MSKRYKRHKTMDLDKCLSGINDIKQSTLRKGPANAMDIIEVCVVSKTVNM